MRKIILATLTSGVLFGGVDRAAAECQTFAQARAANPNTYLSYHVVGGDHCWAAGSPHHREQPAAERSAEKPKPQSATPPHSVKLAALAKDAPAKDALPKDTSLKDASPKDAPPKDAPPKALKEAPIDFRNAYELDTTAPSFERAPYAARRIAGTFEAVGLEWSPVESVEQAARLDAIRAVIYGPAPAPPSGVAAGALTHYLKMLAWLLITIGIGAIGIGVFDRYGERAPAASRSEARAWPRVRRLRLREYWSGGTPVVNFIAYLERGGASRRFWGNARRQVALMRRSISGRLLGTG